MNVDIVSVKKIGNWILYFLKKYKQIADEIQFHTL